MNGKRIAIVGSRNYPDKEHMMKTAAVYCQHAAEIISGGARGPDRWAEELARVLRKPMKVLKPNWRKYGVSAGPRRNQQIVDACDVVIAFWDGESRGTADTIAKARAAGKPVFEFQPPRKGEL